MDYRAIMDKLNEVRAITQNNRTVLKAVDARTACLEQFAQVTPRFPRAINIGLIKFISYRAFSVLESRN